MQDTLLEPTVDAKLKLLLHQQPLNINSVKLFLKGTRTQKSQYVELSN